MSAIDNLMMQGMSEIELIEIDILDLSHLLETNDLDEAKQSEIEAEIATLENDLINLRWSN